MPLFCGAIQDPQGDLKKHSIFKSVSKAEKIRKPVPRASKTHEKSTSESPTYFFAKTWFLQYLPYGNLVLRAPTVNNSTQKSMQKVTWKQAAKKTQNLIIWTEKGSENEVPKSSQITKNLVLGPHVSFLLLPWCARASLSCQNGPQDNKWRHQACQMIGFGHPTWQYPCPMPQLEIKMPCKLTSGQPASAHWTGKPRSAKHTKTSKLNKAAELAQRSHNQAALFQRVGAGGRGRSP